MLKRSILGAVVLSAIVSCGGGSGGGNESSAVIGSVLVLLYSYPATYPEEYEKLFSLQTNKEILVVVNPNNGVGSTKDPSYESVISRYKQKGYKVLGYVLTNYGNRDVRSVKDEMRRYAEFYPLIDGFFVDEVSDKLSNLPYYRDIHQKAKELGKAFVVLNPGMKVPQEYYDIANRIVIFEESMDFLFNNYRFDRANPKDCFLVYGVPSEDRAISLMDYLHSKDVRCMYITHENHPPTWFALSHYMTHLLR